MLFELNVAENAEANIVGYVSQYSLISIRSGSQFRMLYPVCTLHTVRPGKLFSCYLAGHLSKSLGLQRESVTSRHQIVPKKSTHSLLASGAGRREEGKEGRGGRKGGRVLINFWPEFVLAGWLSLDQLRSTCNCCFSSIVVSQLKHRIYVPCSSHCKKIYLYSCLILLRF